MEETGGGEGGENIEGVPQNSPHEPHPLALFMASSCLVTSFAPSALPPSPTTRERSSSRATTTIRSLKDTSIASSKPTTSTKASVQRTSNELLSLLQRKASSSPSSSSRTTDNSAEDLDVHINSLVRALVLSRTPFDPRSSIDGPLFASIHFIGETPLWEKIGLAPSLVGAVARRRRNIKGQRYALDDGTFVNYAEILGDKLYLTAGGNFDDAGSPARSATTASPPNADSATMDNDGVSRRNNNPFEAMFASLFRSNNGEGGSGTMERQTRPHPPALLLPTPNNYSANVTVLGKFAFDVSIGGTATVRVLYADWDLRVLSSPEDTNVKRGGGGTGKAGA